MCLLECASDKPTTPYLCLELVYVSTLLEDGFGFASQTPLLVCENITHTLTVKFHVFYCLLVTKQMRSQSFLLYFQLAKKINGYEICWALGAMFDVMSRE